MKFNSASHDFITASRSLSAVYTDCHFLPPMERMTPGRNSSKNTHPKLDQRLPEVYTCLLILKSGKIFIMKRKLRRAVNQSVTNHLGPLGRVTSNTAADAPSVFRSKHSVLDRFRAALFL